MINRISSIAVLFTLILGLCGCEKIFEDFERTNVHDKYAGNYDSRADKEYKLEYLNSEVITNNGVVHVDVYNGVDLPIKNNSKYTAYDVTIEYSYDHTYVAFASIHSKLGDIPPWQTYGEDQKMLEIQFKSSVPDGYVFKVKFKVYSNKKYVLSNSFNLIVQNN